MYSDDDLIPISAIQHILFCERQYALIHTEGLWEENRFTAEGRVLHERVDTEGHESRRLFRQEFGMAVRSLEWGLIGKCDLVELYLESGGTGRGRAGNEGPGTPGVPSRVAEAVPVEFKRGRDKIQDVDRVQLCAQALCLEELFGIAVGRGQLYYLQEHRRTSVNMDGELRRRTTELVVRARSLRDSGTTPAAVYEKRKCDRCSLVELCMPRSAGSGGKQVARFVQALVQAVQEECDS